MSAYIINLDTMANIAESVANCLNFNSTGINMFTVGTDLQDAFKDCKNAFPYHDFNADLIFEKLYTMNADAVAQRYKEDPEPMPGKIPDGKKLQGNPYTLVKALDCLLYQCSEGNVPDTAVFKAIEGYNRRIYKYIVRTSKEYEAAPWA